MLLKESLIKYDPETGRMGTTPQQVFVELMSDCNLTCVHCPRDFGIDDGQPRQEMPIEIFEKISPWVKNATFVNLNLVGEPLMHTKIDRVLDICGQSKAETSFNTNGILLNDKNCELIVDKGVHSVSISVDGIESNLPIRGFPYETVKKRVINLSKMKEKKSSKLPNIALAFVMMKRNAWELHRILEDILPQADIHAIHVQPLVIFYEGLRDQNIYNFEDAPKAIDAARKVAEKHGVHFSVFRSTIEEDERKREDSRDEEEKLAQLGQSSEVYGCIDPYYEVKVRSTGDIMACSYGRMSGLNLNNLSLDEIWNHEWYRTLRKNLYAKKFLGQCSNCPCVNGSAEAQEDPLREGVHHSKESRFLGTKA